MNYSYYKKESTMFLMKVTILFSMISSHIVASAFECREQESINECEVRRFINSSIPIVNEIFFHVPKL